MPNKEVYSNMFISDNSTGSDGTWLCGPFTEIKRNRVLLEEAETDNDRYTSLDTMGERERGRELEDRHVPCSQDRRKRSK